MGLVGRCLGTNSTVAALFAVKFLPASFPRAPVHVLQSDASESDAPQPPFVWRGRAESGIPAESEAEKAKWVDTRGLLSKIVDVFMKEPMDSLYRFWLASCVEAFLRGGT